jgi:hypothetical protein
MDDDTLAKLELDRIGQPSLADVEHEQNARDYTEHAELDKKVFEILLCNCIVERPVPSVQPELSEDRHHDNNYNHQKIREGFIPTF